MRKLLPSESMGFLLTDVARLYRHRFEQAVIEAGVELSPGEVRILAHTARYGGASQRELADRIGMESATLSHFLGLLEKRGLVQRTPDPSDGRVRIVTVTAEAEKVFRLIRPWIDALYTELCRDMPPELEEALTRALIWVRANLSSDDEYKQVDDPVEDDEGPSIPGL